MSEWFVPFALPFMQQAFVMALLTAVPLSLLSCFVILKGWSLMGDAVSHAVLPGIVVAYVAGLPLILGAFSAGLGCAMLSGWLKDNSRLREDTLLGVVFSGMFGLGIVMLTSIETDLHLDHILFGNMLGITSANLGQSAMIAPVICLAIAIRWRDLLLHAFDLQQARAIGLPTGALHYGLLILLSLAIVSALAATGVILTIAMLIAPGAIAFLLTRRFSRMLLIALTVGTVASVCGVYSSFLLDSAPAPTIVLVLTILFVIVTIATSRGTRSRRFVAAGDATP